MTLLQSFLTTIADAGRDMLEGRRKAAAGAGPAINRLCHDLMSQRGEALGTALAREVIHAYEFLDDAQRLAFFQTLLTDYAPDGDDLQQAIDSYTSAPSPDSAAKLAAVAEAPRQELLRKFNLASGGTAALIAMREHLLDLLTEHPELKTVNFDFGHLLESWFNRGFLEMKRISWHTPANVLEEIIRYEAVHAIRGWDDLGRRLDTDRRCYGFFHPALPDEPLIFVEVALVNGLSASIQVLLDDSLPRGIASAADTAIFYSISNCQRGLKGVPLGNFLIKQVVAELSAELPNLKTFATLSPVPGFRAWLASQDPTRQARLNDAEWQADDDRKGDLMGQCAHYLLNVKRGTGARDPVARFHLGNGACLERLNWRGDTSAKGIAESAGIMVNYLYDPKKIERYHEAYANHGEIACSRALDRSAKSKNET